MERRELYLHTIHLQREIEERGRRRGDRGKRKEKGRYGPTLT